MVVNKINRDIFYIATGKNTSDTNSYRTDRYYYTKLKGFLLLGIV